MPAGFQQAFQGGLRPCMAFYVVSGNSKLFGAHEHSWVLRQFARHEAVRVVGCILQFYRIANRGDRIRVYCHAANYDICHAQVNQSCRVASGQPAIANYPQDQGMAVELAQCPC